VLRRGQKLFVEIKLAADVVTLVVCVAFAYWLLTNLLSPESGPKRLEDYLSVIWIAVPAFVASMALSGLYRSPSNQRTGRLIGSVAIAGLFATLIILGATYITKRPNLSLFALTVLVLAAVPTLVAERLVVKKIIDRLVERWRRHKEWQVLVVGELEDAEEYLRLMPAHSHRGFTVAGVISSQHTALAVAAGGRSRRELAVASAVNWHELLEGYVVDEVTAVLPWASADSLYGLQKACAERGLIFRMLVKMPAADFGRYQIDDLGEGRYLVSLETVPQELLPLLLKRAMDIVGSLTGIVLCGLVYLCYRPRLNKESPGRVIFSQRRIGRNGRVFECYKFRTMCVDAERQQKELLVRSKLGGAFIKLENDPRVTPTGAWLRRHHLDELPQFWNVLRGDMSLVGPRPSQPVEVSHYRDRDRRRLSMKPGITGLFQVNGHAAIHNFDDVVKLDCKYIDNWSLWLDCKIVLKTFGKVFRADGW
jgi:exopolysaccharide biosynthesis polyprenyl glycosylphosphotransferase